MNEPGDLAVGRATSDRFEPGEPRGAGAEMDISIVARFERHAHTQPDRLALRSGDRALTYGALNRAANMIAHRLLAHCGTAPEPIGILLTPGIAPVVAILGVLKSGKFYVPLEPRLPRERLAAIVADAGPPSAILTDDANITAAGAVSDRRSRLIDIDALGATCDRDPGLVATPDMAAYLVYTSGSTGQPKGVVHSHENVLHQITSYAKGLRISVHDRLTFLHSYGFSASRLDIFGALASGAGLFHFAVGDEGLERFAHWLRAEGITLMHWVPTAFRRFAGALRDDERFPAMRCIVLGSEALANRDIALVGKHFDDSCVLVNRFGTTETGNITWHFVDRRSASTGGPMPVGRAIEDTEVLLLDEKGEEVPFGKVGEIVVRSRYLPAGYWRRPALTPLTFSCDASGRRLSRTGDLGHWLPDGALAYLGRKDLQVKIRGYRIETTEIESALLQHAEVREAAVVASENGSGDKELIAYLVGSGVRIDRLRAGLGGKLPDYMMPSAFVVLDRMPLTSTGKLDRNALSTPRAPDGTRRRSHAITAATYSAPTTAVQQELATIFAAVLKIDRIGLYDRFAELGGHSLSAMQIVSRIRQALAVEVPLPAVFDAQTVANLATIVETMRAGVRDLPPMPIMPAARNGPSPLSFAQLRIWFFQQLHPDSAVYNIPYAVRIDGDLDMAALHDALNSVVARHESLRTVFAMSENGDPQQTVLPQLALPLPLVDLQALPHAEREVAAARLTAEEGRRAFDLGQGPLLRACVLRLASDRHVLLLTYHHSCGDYWSAGILFRELSAYYGAFRQGVAASLSQLSIQYIDFARWQRDTLRGERLEGLLGHWRQQLRGMPDVLQLPSDRPRPPVYCHAGAWKAFTLPAGLARESSTLAVREDASLFMVLLTAYELLLAQFSGQEQFLVGAPIAGRNRPETEDLIGVFTNTLPLRADVSANPTFREVVRRVRETTLSAFAHQDLPFDLLVKDLRPKRNSDRPVLVQASFNWQGEGPAATPELPGLILRPFADAIDASADGSSAPRHIRAFLPHNQTVKFDLTLFMWSQGDEVHGGFEYNTSLFEAGTLVKLIEHFKLLLEAVVREPDRAFADLPLLRRQPNRIDERLPEGAAPRRTATRQDEGGIKRKFIAVEPKAIRAEELVKDGYRLSDAAIPVVLEPAVDDVDLAEWASIHRGLIDASLLQHGALLFRGFRLRTSTEFEEFIRSVSGELLDYSYRSTPRTRVEGKIYTSTEYPAEQSIPLHNEMSYSRNWPMKIWFFSVQQAARGGETPIADSRRVYERLDPGIRKRFTDRKVMYVRNYGSGIDLSWQNVFQTADKAELEAFCAGVGMTVEWTGAGRLRTRHVCQSVARHPRTGELVWFNQAHLFHVSSLHGEARACLLDQFDEGSYPRNAYYGDGSPIEDSILDEIRAVYDDLRISFQWRQSDVLMLDNMLVAHGRNAFSGTRKVLVGMAEASDSAALI